MSDNPTPAAIAEMPAERIIEMRDDERLYGQDDLANALDELLSARQKIASLESNLAVTRAQNKGWGEQVTFDQEQHGKCREREKRLVEALTTLRRDWNNHSYEARRIALTKADAALESWRKEVEG